MDELIAVFTEPVLEMVAEPLIEVLTALGAEALAGLIPRPIRLDAQGSILGLASPRR